MENPMHYEGIIECIDYIEDRLSRDELIGYYYGSVLKYAQVEAEGRRGVAAQVPLVP